MSGVLSFQFAALFAAMCAAGCANRFGHRSALSCDCKAILAAKRVDAAVDAILAGKLDDKAVKKLHLATIGFPSPGFTARVVRDKKGNIVRYESIDGLDIPSPNRSSGKQAIEVIAVNFCPDARRDVVK